MLKKIIFLLFAFVITSNTYVVFAQQKVNIVPLKTTVEENIEGKIIKVLEQEERESYGTKHLYQKLEIQILKGKDSGKKIEVNHGETPSLNLPEYQAGDNIMLTKIRVPNGNFSYFVVDYVRRTPIYLLSIIFVFLVLIIARKKGLSSLLGLTFSFLIIFKFIIPNLLDGKNPIQIAVVGGTLAILITFYITHGFKRKTHIAILGTFLSLLITSIVAFYFVNFAHLTGYSSEESRFLQAQVEQPIDIKGLLLVGIIIGLIGILDDITISQAAIVEKLKETSANLSFNELFTKSMDIGKDHIGALVNTLIMVYTGAALPLFLLFYLSDLSFTTVINFEIIAEEVLRILVASIGLMLAVPITTFLACLNLGNKK